ANSIRTHGDYSKPSNKGYRNTIELPVGNNVSAVGKIRDRNAKESWALLEDLALYNNESWNDPRDFAKPVKAISLPQDVPSTSDRRLIELENQENEAEEESSAEPNKTEYTNHENVNETDEEVKRKKEFVEETKGETKEEEEDDPKHFDTFPTMKELRLEPRRKPSNPKKNSNFIGRVKKLRVFVGNCTYECYFMVLEDTTGVIDHYLGSVVFGKPFMEATGLVYNKEEGAVVFERDRERIIFKIPHKIDMFKHVDFTNRGIDSIHPFVIESDDDNCEKTHYSDSFDIGLEYKYEEYVCRGIRSLMAKKSIRKNKGEVT
nr:protein kinase-like domain, concanavalin A-like lectin/glucanase domain protein [Tanacetum cinerariifolium]